MRRWQMRWLERRTLGSRREDHGMRGRGAIAARAGSRGVRQRAARVPARKRIEYTSR